MAKKPNIRFAGFEDDWEQRKVGDITKELSEYAKLNSGLPLLTSARTGLMYQSDYRGNSTTDNENTLFSIVPLNACTYRHMSDDSTFHINVNTLEKGLVSKEYPVFVENESDLRFVVQYINSSDSFTKFCTEQKKGGTRTRLYYKTLCEYKMLIPSLNEQHIIADYFDNLDHLITLHQRKCDELKKVKKFMLQKMFPKKGEKNPEIRFDGFTNDWEQRKLGEVCVRVTRKNKNNESDLPLTIASQYGLIDQRDFFNKVIAAKDMSNYYLLKKGEFAYNKSYSKGFDYGSIKRLNAYEQGCLSTLYICFSIETDEVDSDYLECFFDTLSWYHDVSAICAEGARNHGLLNVDVEAFFKDVNIEMPSQIQEQRKISVFINTLDHLITLHQRKCEELKNVKKYMLQNMFAKGE